jgi:F0F1-type ATP synthase assembly protein I
VGEALTSALDFIGVIFFAVGLGVVVGTASGSAGWGLVTAGVIILIGSFVASALSAARIPRSPE